jgi:NAD(P)-dependent dehydrogenase (short-subunit alcohol dehydrogenase family)
VVARRADRLRTLADEIDGLAVACDLADSAGISAVADDVADRLGSPEILVNAAGTFEAGHAAESEPLHAIQRTLQLNLIAPFLLAQATFTHMQAAGRGAIVNVSSISGIVGVPGIPQASYAASKAGLSGLTRELAVQWARYSIRVNTLAPGFFRSELTAPMYADERSQQWLRRNTPLPLTGSVGDFVGTVLWLVSDAGRATTGQTIVVDGGWTSR